MTKYTDEVYDNLLAIFMLATTEKDMKRAVIDIKLLVKATEIQARIFNGLSLPLPSEPVLRRRRGDSP